MMNQFIENGGNKNYIRYTDGIHIFISDKSEIRKYYKKNKAVKLCRDICESVKKSKDITKDDYTIAVISGNFTQRGESSLVDKWEICPANLAISSLVFPSSILGSPTLGA